MPELYRAADAMLLPTLGENQSLATLEAMASGLPVVTTPIPPRRSSSKTGWRDSWYLLTPFFSSGLWSGSQRTPRLRAAWGRPL